MEFIFHTGFAEELALWELSSVLGYTPEKKSEGKYLVTLENLPELNKVAGRLGGVYEIFYADTGNTVWRHSASHWFKKDRGKPFAQGSKGLLAPKVARMMVNIALGKDSEKKVLLDPFCGSGTVLIEAGEVGAHVIGIDIDKKQLAGVERNLGAFRQVAKIIYGDAVHASQLMNKNAMVDAIVTEPFMGKLKYTEAEVPNIYKGLTKLYLGCLKDWYKILNPGGTIMMAMPIFKYKGKQMRTSDVIDQALAIGYNNEVKRVDYSWPNAQLVREIVFIKKN